VEIFWPLSLCKNGVEIIDSPGLNEHGIREKVTVTYLAQADAILFVMSCIALASQTEINFIEHNLHNSGHREIFFICNRYDQLDSEQDQQRVRTYALQKLSPLTDLEKGVYFLSAKNALNGRVKKKPDLVEESGILELEGVLSEFLVNQRGRLKLRTPALELQRVLRQLVGEVIPGQSKLLSLKSSELDKKVEDLLPQLEEARRSKNQMVRQMDYHFEVLHRDVRDSSSGFLRDLAEQIPTIVNNAKVNTRITTFTIQHKKQIEGVVQEIMDQLDLEIKTRVKAWQDHELEPIFRESILKLNRDMKLQVEEFYRNLEVIKGALFGEEAAVAEGPTGQERFLATALGFVLGDIGSAAYGARFGFHGLFGAIGVQIGVVIGLALTGALVMPWIAIPAIVITSLGNAAYAAGSLETKIRKGTADKIQALFRDSHAQKVAEIVAAVKEKTTQARLRGEEALEREIQSIQEQANQALAEKKKGEVEVEAKRGQMNTLANRIHGISGELRAFVV
jgi:DNA primase